MPRIHKKIESISGSTYGFFQDHIMGWIDRQELPERQTVDNYKFYIELHRELTPAREPQQAKIKRKEKTKVVKRRRTDFDKKRDMLVLAMLHAGRAYICSHPICGQMVDLTVDHIHPLSKGGSDELENLQFLCQKHNSEKGSKFSHA